MPTPSSLSLRAAGAVLGGRRPDAVIVDDWGPPAGYAVVAWLP
jgi:hypothetical protein